MSSSLTTRKLPTGSVEATLGSLTVVVRSKDGFINATRLCKDGGKRFNNWHQLESANAFLESLKGSTGITADLVEVISTGENDDRGTWVHPDVAVQIANWISPEFAVKVSQIVRRYYSGDLTLAGEVVQNHNQVHGTTSTVTVSTVLGKRKAEADLDEQEAKIQALEAATQEKRARMLREALDFLAPPPTDSEVERIRAESDLATIRAHYVKVLTGGKSSTPLLTDGRGSEISFALLEQKMGVRLNRAQRQKAGKRMVELMKERYGADHSIPKKEEYVDGRVLQVNAYWARDEDLMRASIESSL